jgi:hypothetical protein
MAVVSIAFCEFGGMRQGRSQALVEADNLHAEIITPTLASQKSAVSKREFVRIATDVSVFVAVGDDPDATGANRFLMPAHSIDTFRIAFGNRVAVALVEQMVTAPPAEEPPAA